MGVSVPGKRSMETPQESVVGRGKSKLSRDQGAKSCGGGGDIGRTKTGPAAAAPKNGEISRKISKAT